MATPLPIEQASIGMADSVILMILALVVFGPRKLPQIGRQIGKLMYEFRKASNDFKFQMEEELRLAEDAERRQKEEAQRQKALTEQAGVSAPPAAAAETLVDPTVADLTASSPAASAPVAESVPEVHVPRIAEPVSNGNAAEAAASEPAANGLAIQPPSTGETVAAARPGAAAHAEEVTQSAGMESGTETVTQHG